MDKKERDQSENRQNFIAEVIKNNAKILVQSDEGLLEFWAMVHNGTWEKETFTIFDRFLKPDSCYIDIGAWIGPTVLYGAHLAKKVYAFEPDKDAFQILQRNINLNQDTCDKIAAFNFGLNNISAKKTFYVGNGATSMSSILPNETNKSHSYEATFFDLPTAIEKTQICLQDVNFIKIDIEGGEYDLIPHIASYLKQVQHFPTLFVSLHLPFVVDEKSPEATKLALQKTKNLLNCLYLHYNIYLKDFSPLHDINLLTNPYIFTELIATTEVL